MAVAFAGFASVAVLFQHRDPRSWSTTMAAAVSLGVFAALLLDAAGVGFQRAFGPYLVGVTWALAFAGLMFLRVVILPTAASGPPGPA